MVHIGQVISVLGGTSEARTVARWMAASEVIPKGMPGRSASTDLSRSDVAMIVLGMAAPVAFRAPEYASELAQLVGFGRGDERPLVDGGTLLDVLADALSDHERLKVAEVWLPSYEGGRREARVSRLTDEGFRDQPFVDVRSPEELGQVLVETTEDFDFYINPVGTPPLARWQCVDGSLLIRLAKLFVEREGATAPVAVAEDTAA